MTSVTDAHVEPSWIVRAKWNYGEWGRSGSYSESLSWVSRVQWPAYEHKNILNNFLRFAWGRCTAREIIRRGRRIVGYNHYRRRAGVACCAMSVGKYYAQRRLVEQRISCMNSSVINVSGSINCVCFDKVGYRWSGQLTERVIIFHSWKEFSTCKITDVHISVRLFSFFYYT